MARSILGYCSEYMRTSLWATLPTCWTMPMRAAMGRSLRVLHRYPAFKFAIHISGVFAGFLIGITLP